MPKEIIYLRDEELEIRWHKTKRSLDLVIRLPNRWFTFHEDRDKKEQPEYDSLWACFDNEKDLTRLIKSLKRARRQMFWRK